MNPEVVQGGPNDGAFRPNPMRDDRLGGGPMMQQQQQEAAAVDFNALRTLSDDGIDMRFLDALEEKYYKVQ